MKPIVGTTIRVNRGDKLMFNVSLKATGEKDEYVFKEGDVLSLGVYEEDGFDNPPVLFKEFTPVAGDTVCTMKFSGEETKIGDYINEPVDYWYEIVLNEYETVLGYDDNGAKIFRLFPEGKVIKDDESDNL